MIDLGTGSYGEAPWSIAPGRGRSPSPASRSRVNRRRQVPTMSRQHPPLRLGQHQLVLRTALMRGSRGVIDASFVALGPNRSTAPGVINNDADGRLPSSEQGDGRSRRRAHRT